MGNPKKKAKKYLTTKELLEQCELSCLTIKATLSKMKNLEEADSRKTEKVKVRPSRRSVKKK